MGEPDQRRRRSRRHRRNERDHLRERREHQVWLTLDSMKTRGQEEDDIVVVRVVVEAADPRLVGRTRLRQWGQRKERCRESQNDEPSQTHVVDYTPGSAALSSAPVCYLRWHQGR